jgi:hypothetical protein
MGGTEEETMAGKLASVVVITLLCLAGCSSSSESRAPSVDPVGPPDDTVVLAMHLQDERPVCLERVEIWDSEYGRGLKLTTPHYEVFTTLLDPLMLRDVPGFIEAVHHGYNSVLPQPLETVTRFTIFLFANRTQWEDFTRDFAADKADVLCGIKTGAYYLNGACVVYDIGRTRTFSAMAHEGWHQFNSKHFTYRLPSWLDEGVAMLFEAHTCEDGVFRFDPSRNALRLDVLNETLATAKTLSLADVVATSPGEVLATDETEAVLSFYCQSYALVRFLREAQAGRYRNRFHHLLWDALLGTWPVDEQVGDTAADRNRPRTVQWNRQVGPQLFEHYIGTDLGRLESEYLVFCRRIAKEASESGSASPMVHSAGR